MEQLQLVLLTSLLVCYALTVLVLALRRRRPELRIGRAVATALGVRLLAVIAVGATSSASSLRGGDEETFLFYARRLVTAPLGFADWYQSARGRLHEVVFALQLRILDSPDLGLRITQIAIAVAGLCFFATAVYDLAGPRAARITAWVLAFEPSNVFFSGVLHKESLLLLAGGLVAYGGASLWTRNRLTALAPMALGCMIAISTRAHAGWFMIACCGAITFHASMRKPARESLAGFTLLGSVVLMIGLAGPVVAANSQEKLKLLQISQDANAEDTESNLSLEKVDFSTPSAVLKNLPIRIRDMIARPYPWEVHNASQRLGLLGTVVLLVGLGFLIQAASRNFGAVFDRAGPLVYLLASQLVVYAMAAGNAGTGFRYRTHLVAIGLCLVVVLRERHRQTVAAAEHSRRAVRPRQPAPRPATGAAPVGSYG